MENPKKLNTRSREAATQQATVVNPLMAKVEGGGGAHSSGTFMPVSVPAEQLTLSRRGRWGREGSTLLVHSSLRVFLQSS